MENNQIKEAFQKVKQDIASLTNEIISVRSEINEIKILLREFHDYMNTQKLREIASIGSLNNQINKQTYPQTQNTTIQQANQAYSITPTHNPTLPQEIGGLKDPKMNTSTGNEGVTTDKQTYQQTYQQTQNPLELNIQKASEILDSLDNLKKEIRFKFKRITNQEMAVFSTIYQLEEQDPDNTTYKKIATNLKLSESSIRDYVQRIINKGIPIKKQKINNKKILLSVSQDLKKIATLSTIIRLREL